MLDLTRRLELSRFLGRPDLLPVIERSLEHYGRYLVGRDGHATLDPSRLQEPSSIAHSAFMILSLLGSGLPGREHRAAALAHGILGQQRDDGSYRIYFEEGPDEGLEFYPGEAMLALLEAYRSSGERSFLQSVERGFTHCRRTYGEGAVAPRHLAFHANWQSQYCQLLFEDAERESLRRRVGEFVFALHDRIVHQGFYENVERLPSAQATVEVACALEGINGAYAVALREQDALRAEKYGKCIRIALSFLFRAQRLVSCTPREKGGFGHSLTERFQRIDVGRHVASGFIRTARNGVVHQVAGP